MAKYKAYPEYKDSGVEWCSKLPLGWKKTNLRWLSNIYAGGTPSKNVFAYWENGTVPWINSGAVNQSYVTEPSTYISKTAFENSSAKWIPKGALTVALAGQGKTKGMVAQLGIDTTCNQSMAAIVFHREYLSRYIFWWLTSNYQNIRNMAGGDLRDGLNLELLGDIQCPQPKDNECNQIAAFLDHETAKIDNLIEKQQQLIKLLKEKRQAVISHAVTKGLNPDVPMKDSGVEWLGEVPEHWVPSRLKYHTRQIVDGAHFTPTYTEIGIPFLRVTDIQDESINFDNIKFIPEHEHKELIKRCKPESGDLLLSKNGTIGVPKLINWNWEFSIFVSLCLIKFKETLTPEYSEYFFKSHEIKEQISGLVKQSTVINLHLDKIQNFWFCIPSLEEQWKIVNFLNEQTKTLDGLVESAEVAIQLMQERRTALISAAVTGKIDVRDWVAPNACEAEVSQEATA
ncbi:restriction endonuclease subunit S [Hafnia paralvei]|uniref:restriction endonuclease subunit S n=1 Tax=Hafnia paralvei TaxID=546367 RepID=UPI001FFF1201|nr:restriction endonuclease subunit S [Hafnia paralvei]MCK2179320.1 restriction endonuclease subunit S [Hafnia paralvei]